MAADSLPQMIDCFAALVDSTLLETMAADWNSDGRFEIREALLPDVLAAGLLAAGWKLLHLIEAPNADLPGEEATAAG